MTHPASIWLSLVWCISYDSYNMSHIVWLRLYGSALWVIPCPRFDRKVCFKYSNDCVLIGQSIRENWICRFYIIRDTFEIFQILIELRSNNLEFRPSKACLAEAIRDQVRNNWCWWQTSFMFWHQGQTPTFQRCHPSSSFLWWQFQASEVGLSNRWWCG